MKTTQRLAITAAATLLTVAALTTEAVQALLPATTVTSAHAADGNPLRGKGLWVDPSSQAYGRYREVYKQKNMEEAKLLWKIAGTPQAKWLGEWSPNVKNEAMGMTVQAARQNAMPIMIAYNVPGRDCGQHSKGGASGAARYKSWIQQLAAGIGTRAAVVVVEPDALPQLTQCLNEQQQAERLELISFAVQTLKQNPATIVYLDAGHARWQPAETMAERLNKAGIAQADGFSLNVSNYVGTDENLTYGARLSELVGGKHFVIDTSRNGFGATPENEWCNPPGRALGARPTIRTGHPAADAFLWLKRPGESDGACNGGPAAGKWYHSQALELARNAAW